MFREYQDARIKRNLKIVKTLSLIALILWSICTFTYLFTKWYLYEEMISHPQNLMLSYICNFWGGEKFWEAIFDPYKTADLTMEIEWDILYCLFYFEFALLGYFYSKTAMKKKASRKKTNKNVEGEKKAAVSQSRIKQWWHEWVEKYSVESKRNNDLSNCLTYILSNFIPVAVFVVMLLAGLIALMAGTYEDIADGVRSVSYHLGIMLLSHIFMIISSGFLIQNRILIKREWEENPPPFLRKEQLIAEMEAQRQKHEQDSATCKTLLNECGMQFFIEYYPQLIRLPISDINVSDHYFPERQVRLIAAKKIVDLGLTECALHYIIETFGDVLSSEIIERAKTILNEIQDKKGETK